MISDPPLLRSIFHSLPTRRSTSGERPHHTHETTCEHLQNLLLLSLLRSMASRAALHKVAKKFELHQSILCPLQLLESLRVAALVWVRLPGDAAVSRHQVFVVKVNPKNLAVAKRTLTKARLARTKPESAMIPCLAARSSSKLT